MQKYIHFCKISCSRKFATLNILSISVIRLDILNLLSTKKKPCCNSNRAFSLGCYQKRILKKSSPLYKRRLIIIFDEEFSFLSSETLIN